MSIVIVGAGLAGATVVTELRERGYGGDVVLAGAEDELPYERPPLSKGLLLGTQKFADALVHDQAWYDEHRVDLRLATTVTAIDPVRRLVRTASAAGPGEADDLPYDQLVLATGAAPRQLPMAAAAGPTFYLRTIQDSRRLLDALRPGARVKIVGAGWIGLEVAAAARAAGAEVTVFEAAELPLLRVLGPEVAQAFADLHRGHGVDLRLGVKVSPDDLADADAVVVGIGATPVTNLGEVAGLAVDNGVLVDARLRTSDPHIFAIGDIANVEHPTLGRRSRVEHWDNAIEQGKVAAHNLLGDQEEYTHLPYFFTDQYDLGMEYFGGPGPDGYDRVDIEGSTDVLNGGAFRAFWVLGGEVVAAMHANDWDASDEVRASVGKTR